MVKTKKLCALAFAPLLFLLLVGCNTIPSADVDKNQPVASETKEEMVMRRSKEFWDARIAGDIDKAYQYLSPGSKTVLSTLGFANKSSHVKFTKFETSSVTCEEDACYVNGMLTYDHPKMNNIRTPIKDIWVFEQNEAWYVFPQ